MTRHVHIIVKGSVQGVFYRASTKQKADELGLRGWVRNLADGSVEIEVEGLADQIAMLESWCRQGPPRANVISVEIQEGEVKDFREFRVLR